MRKCSRPRELTDHGRFSVNTTTFCTMGCNMRCRNNAVVTAPRSMTAVVSPIDRYFSVYDASKSKTVSTI